MTPFEERVFDTWTDKLVERIAQAYQKGDYDKYEDLLDEYSYNISNLRNMLEDRVTDYRIFGSHLVG